MCMRVCTGGACVFVCMCLHACVRVDVLAHRRVGEKGHRKKQMEAGRAGEALPTCTPRPSP